jgi:hypothetical protein
MHLKSKTKTKLKQQRNINNMDLTFDYVPNRLEDDDSDLEEYEQRTFEADARIFHQDAWTRKVPRDRSIVTLPALVKEFNAAFNNDDGRKRILKEYRAAEQVYINDIEDEEKIRVYPNLSSRATKLPCISNNFFRFFQLFQKYDYDQKQREKSWDREREGMRREMAEMRKAIWVYRKCHANHEKYNVYLERADEDLKFYVESSDSDEDQDEDSDEEQPPAPKKRKTSDGSGGGGGSSSSSQPVVAKQPEVVVVEQAKKKKKKKLKIKKTTPEEEVCSYTGKGAPPTLSDCKNGCGNKLKHMNATAYCRKKKISQQIDTTMSYVCKDCSKKVLANINLVGKLIAWYDRETKTYVKGKVVKETEEGFEIEFENDEWENSTEVTRAVVLKRMWDYDEHF